MKRALRFEAELDAIFPFSLSRYGAIFVCAEMHGGADRESVRKASERRQKGVRKASGAPAVGEGGKLQREERERERGERERLMNRGRGGIGDCADSLPPVVFLGRP